MKFWGITIKKTSTCVLVFLCKLIRSISMALSEIKNGDPINFDQISARVTTTGLFHDPLRIGQSKHSTQTAEAVIGFFIFNLLSKWILNALENKKPGTFVLGSFCDLVRILTLNLHSRNVVLYTVELRSHNCSQI